MGDKFDIENFPESPSALKMLSYVSDGFYDNSYVGKWLYQIMGLEYDEAAAILETLPDQMFPETATWGLMYHEIKWGLPIRENLSYEERRKLIYQKRDYRAPMTPYRMEVLLSDLSGCKVSICDVHDPRDNGYIPWHPNVFQVSLETGDNAINLGDILQKLRRIKQSHTTFTFRVTTMVHISIGVNTEIYKTYYRLCGTYPKTSMAWRILHDGVEIAASGEGFKTEFPMAGDSGETGTYPKTSTGLKIADEMIAIHADGKGIRSEYPMTGQSSAGQYPKQSTGYKSEKAMISAKATGEGSLVKFELTGMYPKTSMGHENLENTIAPEVTTQRYKIAYPLCGSPFEI